MNINVKKILFDLQGIIIHNGNKKCYFIYIIWQYIMKINNFIWFIEYDYT